MIKEELVEKAYCDRCHKELEGLWREAIHIQKGPVTFKYEFELCEECYLKLLQAIHMIISQYDTKKEAIDIEEFIELQGGIVHGRN